MTPRQILTAGALLVAGCGDNHKDEIADAPSIFTLSGTITGYAGSGLVLTEGTDQIAIPAHATSFAFPASFHDGDAYAIAVMTQPTGPMQDCAVPDASGRITGDTTVNVVCTTRTYPITPTISGLLRDGLVLQNNGGDDLVVVAPPSGSSTTATFATEVASGASYALTVRTNPPSQSCTVSGGTGTIVDGEIVSVMVDCADNRYTIGGTVTGLEGSGLTLENQGGDDLSINANGTFAFTTTHVYGEGYAITVGASPISPWQTCAVTQDSGTFAAADVSNIAIICTTNLYDVVVAVSGLAGGGLVVRNNGGDALAITTNGSATFATKVESGGSYAVDVFSSPTSPWQTCVVGGGNGTITSASVSVVLSCSTNLYAVAGTVTGLAGSGLVLHNGSEDIPVASDGAFTFPTQVASGGTFNVSVGTQPTNPSQICTITGGAGTITNGDTSVQVSCATNAYTIGGTVSGLAGSGLVLHDNAGDPITVSTSGAFTFPTALAGGATYAVTVAVDPTVPWQTCTVTGGSGTVAGADITSVAVTCATNMYVVNVAVTGLQGNGLRLNNNAGDDLPVSADGNVTFATPVPSGGPFDVTIDTQPTNPSQTCSVSNGSGSGTVANSNPSVTVSCATNAYSVGGTVTGMVGSGLVLHNNAGDPITVAPDGVFTFPTTLLSGAPYAVTVASDPTLPWQTCTVTNGAGMVDNGNVTSVAVNCTTNDYVVNVSVTGLLGSGLVLRNNGGDDLAIVGDGTVAFATGVASGTNYDVTVQTAPVGPTQTCTITGGSDTITNNHVTVGVACATNEYTVGGSINGIPTGTSVTLTNNGGDDVILLADGEFTFPTAIASDGAYSVAATADLGTVCNITNPSGTVTSAAITDIVVGCFTSSGLTFHATGAVQTFIVPGNVRRVMLDVFGARGGSSAAGVLGGLGGKAGGTLAVTPGQVLTVVVGASGSTTAFNGGGAAGPTPCPSAQGGAGGGASDVRTSAGDFAHRLIVAGGGGGAAGSRTRCGRGTGGGGGGGLFGGGGGAGWPYTSLVVPTGGTQLAGGSGGTSAWTRAPDNNGTAGRLGVGGVGGAEISSLQGGAFTGAVGALGGGATGDDGTYVDNFTGQSGAGGSGYIGGVTGGAIASGVDADEGGDGKIIISW